MLIQQLTWHQLKNICITKYVHKQSLIRINQIKLARNLYQQIWVKTVKLEKVQLIKIQLNLNFVKLLRIKILWLRVNLQPHKILVIKIMLVNRNREDKLVWVSIKRDSKKYLYRKIFIVLPQIKLHNHSFHYSSSKINQKVIYSMVQNSLEKGNYLEIWNIVQLM